MSYAGFRSASVMTGTGTTVAAGDKTLAAGWSVRDAREADLAALAGILNAEVLTSTASWTTTPKSDRDMTQWYDRRVRCGYPVLVAEMTDGTIIGYASFGPFRRGEGYAATVEHTVYVAGSFRRGGVAAGLLTALIDRAREHGVRVMVGGISGDAAGSLALHRKLGFAEAGRIPSAGKKFGRWLDLVFMVREL